MNQDRLIAMAALISSGIITPEEYLGWADRRIMKSEDPDEWLLDLSLEKDPRRAAQLLRSRANEISEVDPGVFEFCNIELCSEYLKYKNKNFGWAVFLEIAIQLSMKHLCGWPTHDFKRLYDAYIENEKPEMTLIETWCPSIMAI